MKLAIMQPYFFPYIGYFQVIHAVDKYLLHGGLPYLKKGWVNRNRILGPDGKPAYVNAEIRARSSHTRIDDIQLVPSRHWREKVLRAVSFNYRNSPFFKDVYAVVETAIATDTHRLSDLNRRSILAVCDYLGIRTAIETAEKRYTALEDRLSEPHGAMNAQLPGDRPGAPARKVARILEICRQEGADTFVNAIGGRALYDKAEFRRNGVDLFFVEMQPFVYPQRAGPFVPDLSIIDVLMSCGRAGTQELLVSYRLV